MRYQFLLLAGLLAGCAASAPSAPAPAPVPPELLWAVGCWQLQNPTSEWADTLEPVLTLRLDTLVQVNQNGVVAWQAGRLQPTKLDRQRRWLWHPSGNPDTIQIGFFSLSGYYWRLFKSGQDEVRGELKAFTDMSFEDWTLGPVTGHRVTCA